MSKKDFFKFEIYLNDGSNPGFQNKFRKLKTFNKN